MEDEMIEKIVLYYLIFAEAELDLSEEDFTSAKNRQIYAAIKKINAKHGEINAISIKNELNGNIEVLKYISDLAEFKYGTSLEYAYKQLKDMTKKRKVSALSLKLTKEVEEQENIEEYIENTIKELNEINKDMTKEETIIDSAVKTADEITKKHQQKYEYKYFTGIFDLDEETNGLHEEELTIVGARPSVGKSTFALQIASKIAEKGIHVGYISLEMSDVQIIQKLASRQTRIDSKKIRNAQLTTEELMEVDKAIAEIATLNLNITTRARSIQEIELYAKRMKNKWNLGLLIIDYLQLITNKEKTNSREQEIASITRSLKLLSLELKIPIIALSQMRRESARTVPTLADLRESGAIEQDADNVIFLYREDDDNKEKAVEDIIVDLQKQRAGGLVKTQVRFDKKISTFTNLTMRR